MLQKIQFTFLLFFGCLTLQSQIVNGKIINASSSKPIQDVAILTDLNKGSISDENGRFSVSTTNLKTITFSILGFETTTLKIEDLKRLKYIVSLVEKVNELNEIQLNLAKISLDSLLIKTQKNMDENFIAGPLKHQFFVRENTVVDFQKLALDLERSSLLSKKNRKLAEQELTAYSKELKSSTPEFSSEFTGILLSKKIISEKEKKNVDLNKMDSISGYRVFTGKKNITLKEAQNDFQNIILKHLNRDKTYKISSGLFTIEDSLSIKKILQKRDSVQADNSFKEFEPMYLYTTANKKSKFFREQNEDNFFDRRYYNHTLQEKEILGTTMLYVIGFSPRKSKSKYRGRIFINPKDFTIAKIEYEFAEGKRGMHVNLKWVLGLKVSLDLKKVTLFYEKNKEEKVYNSYYKETSETYAYVHRPIKFKENSKTRNKVKFDIKVELNTEETIEVLLLNAINIDESLIQPMKKGDVTKSIYYTSLEDYNNTTWKNRQLIIEYLKKYE
ncbi:MULTISPECIES: carboxypeptidase-like regulatory domain-containing protein [unclassified Polaribacter]|uniref:carboxypeptidase-like regulatory domain-containing protein n=1 Tax=unclassified Polaribacter TaxID=196858 RepID=UPI0011BE3FDE|nr:MULTISPECIES: carboxypeptidase-like regulatory domain-containing protein [unclassified Polaribacter]TXD52512.1 carboxypeptidase-like regulatory domain-containing protein [Polaribacter sp. IC063]TXD60498.1 carboxypeptidase-like regulatory domain-containing protein [Polaribacter sp. IC066]